MARQGGNRHEPDLAYTLRALNARSMMLEVLFSSLMQSVAASFDDPNEFIHITMMHAEKDLMAGRNSPDQKERQRAADGLAAYNEYSGRLLAAMAQQAQKSEE